MAGKPLFSIGAAQLAAVGYFTVTACIPQRWLASAGPHRYRRNQSKYEFASDTRQTRMFNADANLATHSL